MKPKILVVDDVELHREFAMLVLEEFGCEVSQASNGSEAVELVLKSAFDLVLMDCEMPVMDGLTAAVEIRSRNCPTPIVAHTTLDNRQACLEVGMNDHIPKPAAPAALIAALRPWLQR